MQEICKICGDSFDEEEYRWKKCVHHIDGNRKNNNPENLMMIHISCHVSLHWKDLRYRNRVIAGLSAARLGMKFSKEHKRNLSRALRGNKNHLGHFQSKKTREKISQNSSRYWKGRKRSEESKMRRSLSRKIGKEKYALIAEELLWNGNQLININEIWKDIYVI